MASTVVKDEIMEIDEINVEDENDEINVEDENEEFNRRAESQPKKRIRRKKVSKVWKHFTEVTVSEGCTRAVCKKCKQSLVYINGSKCVGTSHLKRHIAQGICRTRSKGTNSQKTSDTPKYGASGSESNPSGEHCGESFSQIPLGHEDSGMPGQIGASLSPASNQSLHAAQGNITANKEPGSCEANAIFIEEPEHLPLSEPNSVSDLPGKVVGIGNMPSSFAVDTETIESLEDELVRLVEEPMKATMKMPSAKCPTPPTSVDVNLIQGRVIGEFEVVDNFRIPKEVIKPNDDILLACSISLLKIISDMETVRGEQLSLELVERWEGLIKDAETMGFNFKWFRERLNRVRKHWMSSFNIDKEVESHRQVLDAMQVKYDDLCTRKGVLETTLSEVKIQITNTEGKLSSEREAIQEKLTQKRKFQKEPVSRW